MQSKKILFLIGIITIIIISAFFYFKKENIDDDLFVSYTLDVKKKSLKMFWKNDSNQIIGSLLNLKALIENKNQKLLFAMNGGMYKINNSPQGLYIENGKKITEIDTTNGEGNFYLKPNGVFYITKKNEPHINASNAFRLNDDILFATQSGPMLVIEGDIHPVFKQDSKSLNIRNGVGILPNGNVLFAMSKKEINFYDFANYFKMKGCKNALYLDGFVSRMYLPEKKWEQLDGDFGVMIGVVENKTSN
jgi:uncharacterized protein YigE (DUF2233 family)